MKESNTCHLNDIGVSWFWISRMLAGGGSRKICELMLKLPISGTSILFIHLMGFSYDLFGIFAMLNALLDHRCKGSWLPVTFWIPGCVGRVVRLGSESSSAVATCGIRKSRTGHLEICEFVNLETWKSGNLAIWEYVILEF